MVKAFHDQGLKIYVDMVYNHTAEGDVDGTGDIGRLFSCVAWTMQLTTS